MLGLGRLLAKGGKIRADDHNAFQREVNQALTVLPGQGIQATWGRGGIAIAASIDRRQDFLVWARITARTGSDPDLAENIRYSAKGIFQSSAILTNVYPSCGRPVKAAQAGNVRIKPAVIGALCFIVRDKQPDGTITPKLWFPGEGGDYEALNVKKCA